MADIDSIYKDTKLESAVVMLLIMHEARGVNID